MPAGPLHTAGQFTGDYPKVIDWLSDLPAGPLTEPYRLRLLPEGTINDLIAPQVATDLGGHYLEIFTDTADIGNGGPDLPTVEGSEVSGMIRSAQPNMELRLTNIAVKNLNGGLASSLNSMTVIFNGCCTESEGTAVNQSADWQMHACLVFCNNGRFHDLRSRPDAIYRHTTIIGNNAGDYAVLLKNSDVFDSCCVFGFTNSNSTWNGLPAYLLTDQNANGTGSIGGATLTDSATPPATSYNVENVAGRDYRLKVPLHPNNVAVQGGNPASPTTADQIGNTYPSPPDNGPFSSSSGPGSPITGDGACVAQSSTTAGTGSWTLVIDGVGNCVAGSATSSGFGGVGSIIAGTGQCQAGSASTGGSGSVIAPINGIGRCRAGTSVTGGSGTAEEILYGNGACVPVGTEVMAKRAPGNRTTVGVNWIEGFELMYSMANNGDGSMTITMTGSSPVTLDNHAPAALITQLVIGDLTAGFRGTIRNVKIFDENDQLIHFWQVNDNDTAIADSVGAITGSLAIGNGYWY